MTTSENPRITATAGTMTLEVWYVGDRPDENGGVRCGYGYRIADDSRDHQSLEDDDLESGVGADIDVHHAMGTLVNFLCATADAYRVALQDPDAVHEILDSFPEWVGEAAYINESELSVLVWETKEGSTGTERRQQPLTGTATPDNSPPAPPRPYGPSAPSM